MDEGGLEKKGLTRRQFLKGTTKVIAGAALAGSVIEGSALWRKRKWIVDQLTNERENVPLIEEAKDFLLKNYGVTVTLGESWDTQSFSDELRPAEAMRALGIVIEEMGRYPFDFFKRNKLSSIRIASNLRVRSFLFTAREKGGTFNSFFNSLLLSFDGDPEYFRQTFHHELYHLLDYRDGGFENDDDRWMEIHKNCSCGAYGAEEARRTADIPSNSAFASDYGSSHPSEDRAEFGARMMVPSKHALLLRRIRDEKENGESILAEKYSDMRAVYRRWSGGTMDDAYWKTLISRAPETGARR